MSLCICGHAQKEHISADGLDNSCQVDECGCSNYATPTEEQKDRFAQSGWGGGTDRQDSSESDSITQETPPEVHQAAEELEGVAAEVYERKDKVENDRADEADVNSNAQPNDSQAQVMVYVQSAIEKVDKVDADAKKKIDKVEARAKKAKSQIEAGAKKAKSKIVQELARDLEGKIPTDEISLEITHQLHGRVSERLIHDCLDEKYKKKHRIENARKQKKMQEQDLAALNKPVPLNSEIVVDNSGNQTVESAAETRQPDRSVETGINAYTSNSEPASEITAAQQEEVVNANRPQPRPGIGIGIGTDQPVCEHCSTKDAKIMELEQALKNLKTINSGTGNHIEASSAHNRVYTSFDNSELSGEREERESHRKCKNCEILQQKYEQLQSKLQGYEEVVRTHTSIKTAKELYRSTDGYQQFEFSVPFELLRRHMVYSNGINGPLPVSIWFNGKFDRNGKMVDVRIGKITDTDTTEGSRMTP
jgi:hypothetical protein